MNSLNHLSKVVKRLKEHEIDTLKAFLKSFKIDYLNEKSLSASLIELLSDEKQPKVPEVLQFKIYGKPQIPAFEKLVQRTRDKVYESLLFDNNLKKVKSHSERSRVGYDLRKKLIETEILASRGLTEDNEDLYEYMLSKALKYEYYDILLEILYTKHTYSAFRYGTKRIKRIESEIHKYEKLRNAVNQARLTFERFAAQINFSASSNDYIKELPAAVSQLKSDYEITGSPTIGYFLYLLEAELFQQSNRLYDADASLIKLIDLLKISPSIQTRNRLGTAYINLANNKLLEFEFNAGLKSADSAEDYFKDTTVNRNVVHEIKFLLNLFDHEFSNAEKLISDLYASSSTQKTSFLFYKRTYYYACLKNLQGDFKSSDALLNEVKEIEKDKEGWNIGIRLLQIMNNIDRGKHDLVESQVQNLKKYLSRLKGQTQARRRYAVILRVLSRLMNDNFSFSKTWKRSQKYFELLASDDEKHSWAIKGPEVIAFHEWFASRMELRRFSYRKLFGASGK